MEATNSAKQKTKSVPFFPGDYLIMTVTSLIMLWAVAGLGGILIDYWLNGRTGILADFQAMHWVAATIVVVPLHLLAYLRIRHTNRHMVTLFSMRVAHGLLGLYLLFTVGTFIILSTALVAAWLNALLGTGSIDRHLLTITLALVQAIAWFAYATWHFGRVRTDKSRPKYYVITVTILSFLLVVLSLAFPVRTDRGAAKDLVKANDLGQIHQEVGEFVDEHGALPASLGDLEGLGRDTTRRLHDYRYTAKGGSALGVFGYELCATFAKSAGQGRDTGLGYLSHGAGEQCFNRFTVSGSKLRASLDNYVKDTEDGAVKLAQALRNYLGSVESTALNQVEQLEHYMEGLENSTEVLQREMSRLQGNLGGLEGDTGQLAQDFADVEQFFRNLLCGVGLCGPPQN